MSARGEVMSLADSLGATWDERGSGNALDGTMDAPGGKRWLATDTHGLSVCYYSDRTAGWWSLLADMRMGLIDCDDPECEECE